MVSRKKKRESGRYAHINRKRMFYNKLIEYRITLRKIMTIISDSFNVKMIRFNHIRGIITNPLCYYVFETERKKPRV